MVETVLEIWNKILTSNLFNFVLMLVLLGWLINKLNLADALEKGRKSIEERITNAKKEHKDAVESLYETQEKGIDVEREALEIIDKSAKNAVLVGEKLVDDAIKQAQAFSKTTEKAIKTNIDKLKMNLTNETAQASVELAKKHIQNLLDEDRNMHIKYINESIKTLGETMN